MNMNTTPLYANGLQTFFPLSQNGSLTWQKKLGIALAFAAFTGLLAQVRIPLPFTPVPITGQTFAVCLTALLLGKNWGGISQLIYVTLGAAGLPWFSDLTGGFLVLAGPTGGYLAGFVLVAFVLGYARDYFKNQGFATLFLTIITANIICVFLPGLIVLGLWMSLVKGQTVTLIELLSLGYFPFVVGDILKSLAVAGVVKKLSNKFS